MNISLSVERLVLEGLPLGAEALPQLQAALEAELARLLGQGGLDPGLLAGGAVPSLNSVQPLRAGDLALEPGGDPAQLGVQLARAVYTGLGGGAPRMGERIDTNGFTEKGHVNHEGHKAHEVV